MSKQHRPKGPESPATAPTSDRIDTELAEALKHGNQAASERIPSASDPVRDAAQALAERAALALRIAPRDPAWTERLTQIVEGSGLSADRREIVTLRLRSDQATADEVGSAVRSWLGTDGDELRADLVQAFDAVARDPAGNGDAEQRVASAVADRTGQPVEAVHGLCRDLVLLVAFVWDEEEEQGPPGDYLAEESGY